MNKAVKLFSMLGFAQKGNKLVSGESAVKAMFNKGQIYLLILAEDLGDNRKRFWMDVAGGKNVPVIIQGKKNQLGVAVGLSPRSILGITDQKMAEAVVKMQ
ncbi:MAG: L7Ae/L30e/S12e/Gadd45 family ribosomal protein [Peptococcales bacterium]|jgi:ribosomal protein L7Ae-like RNA K-turn-binding protein